MTFGSLQSIITADVLIVGSGLAGLLLALKLRSSNFSVVLATKGALVESNSSWAQGGVAAVTGANPFDAPTVHLNDTIKAGAGLTDHKAAENIVFGGARLIAELSMLGVAFDKSPVGMHDLALEGGHKQARVLHTKDTTGLSITAALIEKIGVAAAADVAGRGLTVLEHSCATDLVVIDGVCAGAKFVVGDDTISVRARHTVLATGGLGQVFERTTNPAVATGDGIALAYRAGAVLADMEFVQFHPTALRKDNAPAFLISEAARGAGATLVDHKGRRFVKRFHHDGELATRDIVARAIHTVMLEHGLNQVFLDMRPIGAEKIRQRFPNILNTCALYGVDILSQPIPIAPAAHYMMGGIDATTSGRTSIAGLYAIGECACTGLHGANRLASNSLLEAGVMALNLADELTKDGSNQLPSRLTLPAFANTAGDDLRALPTQLDYFRSQMYRHAGLVRSQTGLQMLLGASSVQVGGRLTARQYEAQNIMQVGLLIARAALLRRESRGAHLRDDYQSVNDESFGRRLRISKTSLVWDKQLAAVL